MPRHLLMKAGPTTTASPSGEMWGALIAVAVLSMLMVVAMVQFSKAVLDPSVPADVRSSRRKWWGVAYAALWIGIIGAFVVLLRHERGPHARTNWLLLAGMAGGWWALHGLILWFGGALSRANARDRVIGDDPAGSADADAEVWQEKSGEEASEGLGQTDDEDDDDDDDDDDTGTGTGTGTEPVSRPTPRSRGRDTLRLIRNVVLVLVIVAVAGAIGPLRRTEDWMNARRSVLLPAAIAVAAAGFVLLLGGGIYRVLAGRGRAMTRKEFESLQGRRSSGGPMMHRGVYRFRGTFVGRSADDSASFSEVKQAWRDGSWRRSPRWRALFAMSAGGLLMFFGGFSIPLVLAPAGIKVIVAGCMAYAAVRLLVAFRRAP